MKDFPPFRLDGVNQCLWRHRDKGGDERILLTPKAFAVLRCLMDHAGRLVTHDELLDAVWPNTQAFETYASIGMPLHCDLTKALMDRVHSRGPGPQT